jgi:hypothetical protein
VGLLLVIMPWWPALWDHNYFVERWPAREPFLTNNFLRGAVTGLGLVNLFAGFADLALIFQHSSQQPAGPPEGFER